MCVCIWSAYRMGLGVVPAVGRGGSKLLSFDSARRGELLLVHGDVELRGHLGSGAFALNASDSHGQPSPLPAYLVAPPFPTHHCTSLFLHNYSIIGYLFICKIKIFQISTFFLVRIDTGLCRLTNFLGFFIYICVKCIVTHYSMHASQRKK